MTRGGMRFLLGPKPYATDFDPSGWTEVRVPRHGVVLALAGVALASLVCIALLLLCLWLAPGCFKLAGYRHWQLALIFVLTIPAHELVHALLQPGLGRDTVFGFWPRRMVFYAFYPGPRTRARTLVGAVGPFLALSMLPLALAAVLDVQCWGVMALVLINGGASSNDLLGFFFVLIKIPRGAEVMGQYRKGYWRQPGGTG